MYCPSKEVSLIKVVRSSQEIIFTPLDEEVQMFRYFAFLAKYRKHFVHSSNIPVVCSSQAVFPPPPSSKDDIFPAPAIHQNVLPAPTFLALFLSFRHLYCNYFQNSFIFSLSSFFFHISSCFLPLFNILPPK
jgi:hypothetical protein